MYGDVRGCDMDAETRDRLRVRVEDERSLRVIYCQFSHRYRVSLNVGCYVVCSF